MRKKKLKKIKSLVSSCVFFWFWVIFIRKNLGKNEKKKRKNTVKKMRCTRNAISRFSRPSLKSKTQNNPPVRNALKKSIKYV